MQATETPVIQLPGGQTLYPFQVDCLRYLAKQRGRALIADEMGLGKTAEAIAWLWLQPRLRPVVICVPASIKIQWRRELARWLDIDPDCITVMQGRRRSAVETDLSILNYDILKPRMPDLEALSPKCVIFDESHFIKSSAAARSKAAFSLSTLPSVSSVLALTGTPILNRPAELWHQLRCINQNLFPNFYTFGNRYCNPQRRTYFIKGSGGEGQSPKQRTSTDYTGASHMDELDQVLRERVMIRRRKEDVLTDLPDYQSATVPFEVDLTSYNELARSSRERLRLWRDELLARRQEIVNLPDLEQIQALAARAEANSVFKLVGYVLAEIEALKQEALNAKLPEVVNWIVDALETGEPLVIFTHHKDQARQLHHQLEERLNVEIPLPLDGDMTQKRRQEYVERFAGGEFPLIIAGLTAMAFGVDGLQHRASHCVFVELGWTPAIHDQAASRLHRHGQQNGVVGHYLLAADTIEESIAAMVDSKSTVVSAAVGEFDALGIIESLIDDILENVRT